MGGRITAGRRRLDGRKVSKMKEITKEPWTPGVGDRVKLIRKPGGGWEQIARRIDGVVVGTTELGGLHMFRVRYPAPWGESSGWYQEFQMELLNDE